MMSSVDKLSVGISLSPKIQRTLHPMLQMRVDLMERINALKKKPP